QMPSSNDGQIVNPLIEQRADPWVYLHTDGYYYFTASVPEYDRIEIRRAMTIQELAAAVPVVVWEKHPEGIMSKHIWAPEIHHIDGKWYIYFAAGREDEAFAIRIYVLENEAENPLEQSWVEKGEVKTRWDSFALDATSFEHQGVRYLVWAQHDPDILGNTNLYIAAMSDPWTIIQPQVMISTPEFEWERRRFLVNEGAAVLKRNGRIYITYSASATNHYYAMGLLTAADDSNLLDPASWSKSPDPVFATNETTGQYGPGHNSFTVSPDGDDILIYHARNYRDIAGDPLYDPNRHTRAQRLYWNPDGTPNFGIPVPDGVHPVRISTETGFIRHDGDSIVIDANVSDIADSQFQIVPGLADSDAISLESINRPGSFLRHRDGGIWLDENDGSDEFANEATWIEHPGLADSTAVSFEAYSLADQYIKQHGNLLILESISTNADRANATFGEEF
ncbi:MAG TPA: family 43 glycosylhydrolase, partial [Aggregatilineales bacterium]|nr:family 43 glycosylhydrolase [Aggregatilineales bacterium]